MRQGTSGVWVTKAKDKITIGYEDYGVSEFGGGDFECIYTLTDENAVKFRVALRKIRKGSLEKAVKKAFGENFNDRLFISFCKENGIEYSHSTWTS